MHLKRHLKRHLNALKKVKVPTSAGGPGSAWPEIKKQAKQFEDLNFD